MKHILQFNDLQIPSTLDDTLAEDPESSVLTSVASSLQCKRPPTTTSHVLNNPSTLFLLDESKKSSYSLSGPVALNTILEYEDRRDNDESNQLLETVEKCINEAENDNDFVADSNSHSPQLFQAFSNQRHPTNPDPKTKVASSSIDCSTQGSKIDTVQPDIAGVPKANSQSNETFLFGGFELITNARSVAVYALRVNGKSATSTGCEDEAYLTTCKGIPARDLPPVENLPSSNNGSGGNNGNSIENLWFKFIFVSPGGPKPVKYVRMKYFGDLASAPQNIIVRLLKIKCRLPDPNQVPLEQPKITQQFAFPSNLLSGMMNTANERSKHNEFSSMMTLMSQMGSEGVNGAMKTNNSVRMDTSSVTIPTNQRKQQREQAQPVSLQQPQLNPQMNLQQTFHQNHLNSLKQQQIREQQDRQQAEIMSSVAGLGIFLKSSEERAMKSFDSSLSAMEDRILKKLDSLSRRLEIIEQHVLQKGEKQINHREGDNGNDGSTSRLDVIERKLHNRVERNDEINGYGTMTRGHVA